MINGRANLKNNLYSFIETIKKLRRVENPSKRTTKEIAKLQAEINKISAILEIGSETKEQSK